MRIIEVDETNFHEAEQAYTASWRASHQHICSPEFVINRDYAGYLRKKIGHLYMICTDVPMGVFYLNGESFGDLYIHPDYQGKGYGMACINFAAKKSPKLRLTVLSDNTNAISLYVRAGFVFTGTEIPRKHGLIEREMVLEVIK